VAVKIQNDLLGHLPFSVFQSSLGWGTRGSFDSSMPLTVKCPKCLTLVNLYKDNTNGKSAPLFRQILVLPSSSHSSRSWRCQFPHLARVISQSRQNSNLAVHNSRAQYRLKRRPTSSSAGPYHGSRHLEWYAHLLALGGLWDNNTTSTFFQ
jgi:hypothetical protein